MQTRIIYEDNHILVVHKPAGLATQTARVGRRDVVSELRNYLSQQGLEGKERAFKGTREISGGSKRSSVASKGSSTGYLGIIHRLDQPVEGLLVFAKDNASAARLSAQLGGGTLNKRYYAVVSGVPEEDQGELADWLVRDPQTQTARVVTAPRAQGVPVASDPQTPVARDPKKAVLQYRVLEKLFTPVPYSLLDIHIDTGRFHQIRVQLSHAGMPILGDHKYGDSVSQERSRQLMVGNIALCAYYLEFRHPRTGKRMEFIVEPEGEIFPRRNYERH